MVEFFYPRDLLTDHPEIVEAHQARTRGPVIVEHIDKGCEALFAEGLDDVGPNQEPLEDGMVHFHRWLRSQLGPHL